MKNTAWFKYLFPALIILLSTVVDAQVKRIGTPYVRNYEVSALKAGAQTWMIDISENGLAYFANNDGILEFDGIHWRKYVLPDEIVVRSAMTGSDGKIYAGGFNQIGYFLNDGKAEMTYISLNELVPYQYRNFGEVWKIHQLPYGIAFQSYKQLMLLIDGEIKVLTRPEGFFFSFYVNSELYISDQQGGLYRLAHDRLVKVPGTEVLGGKQIWSMVSKGNNILIATDEHGIFEFDGIHLEAWENAASELATRNQVYCALAIDDETYAFGTIQDGLIICNAEGEILQHINLDKGLQNNTVLSMKLDQYGNLWLGLDKGIDYVEINSPLTYFTHVNGLSAGYAAVLYEGQLYLGTNRGLFYHEWDGLLKKAGKQEFEIIPGTAGQVWNLEVIDGTLFCGHNSGIFTVKNKTATRVSEVQGGWTFIQPEGRDDIVVCGTYTSLIKFSKENGEWSDGKIIKGFQESSRFLVNAGKNKMWMSHGYLGAFRIHFDENFDSISRVEVYNDNQGFPTNKNITVNEFSGKAVFTTEDGFYKYDPRTNSFIQDKELQNTFPIEGITRLHQDENGNVWYFTSTEAGVFRLQEDGTYFNVDVPFRELNGKFIKWFQFVYPVTDEQVILGTQDGFVHYSLNFSKNYKQELISYIRKVELSGIDSVLFLGSEQRKTIIGNIPHKYNQIQITFSANDFENPGRILFSTFLEGFDEDWSAWQSRSEREFTNLGHGEHIFRVKAKNVFGTLSNTNELVFEIGPPWYLTWWAYVLYGLLVILFFLGLGRYVRYRMEKSQKAEEERQAGKFRELEKKLQTEALEAEKEVIRLRNEKLNVEMKQKDQELANNTMQTIQKSKSLIAIKKELSKIARDINDDLISNNIKLLIRKINREIDTENQWAVFEKHFQSVHEEFLQKLKARYPDLTPRELKLCAYLRLNISSKEIATLMNISIRGVEISRYRLRKKLNLDRDTNLTSFIMSI